MFVSVFNKSFVYPLIVIRSTKRTERFLAGLFVGDRHICDCHGSAEYLTQAPDETAGVLF